MRWRGLLIQSLAMGAVAGLLIEVLLLRLNRELEPTRAVVLQAAPVWMGWGVVLVLPLGLAVAFIAGRRRRRDRSAPSWWVPEAVAALFLLAAVTSRLNADILPEYLSGSGHRALGQDAILWLAAGLMAAAMGWWARRRGQLEKGLFFVLVLALPAMRLASWPVSGTAPGALSPRPLGTPTRGLVVVGVEGLDPNLFMAQSSGGRYRTLGRLLRFGSWGALRPYRPYLRRSFWTTTATGAYPRRHGVKSRWGWRVRGAFTAPLRLLPSTPLGSQWMLPWPLTRRVDPPPANLPPLWERLRASGVPVAAVGWPGVWLEGFVTEEDPSPGGAGLGDPRDDLLSSLETALEPFPGRRKAVQEAVESDLRRLEAVRSSGALPGGAIWVELRALGATRRHLEPLEPQDTGERAVLELVLELLDRQLSELLADEEALSVVVSPVGLSPPDSLERLRRLLGAGGSWRASATGCPDGLLVLHGPGVAAGRRLAPAHLADVAPTLCYLLGLPVAEYMEGRVTLDAVDPDFLAANPLRVVQ